MGGAEADSPTTEVQGETMSKDQKKTIEVPVETVDNWKKAVDHIISSLEFWFPKQTNDWPFNFLIDNLYLISTEINTTIVSSSHIIDK